MRGKWISQNVPCPFYRCEDSRSVFCAGYLEGQYIRSSFPSSSRRLDYTRQYCRGDWRGCGINGCRRHGRNAFKDGASIM